MLLTRLWNKGNPRVTLVRGCNPWVISVICISYMGSEENNMSFHLIYYLFLMGIMCIIPSWDISGSLGIGR